MSVVDDACSLAQDKPEQLLAIVGPTASGKTSLAIAVAERLGGEIISADSVQVYRSFDLGSGKPTQEELARAPHHLVSIVDPMEALDAAAWATRAADLIADVRARGRVPIVCGGSFLWVKALLNGLAAAPAASPEHRERHRILAEHEGRPALHARLAEVDPASGARLHPNDFVRVSRAMEVFELTGRPLSAWHHEHAFAEERYPSRLVALRYTSEELTERIRARIRGWLAEGWVDEVEGLLRAGYGDARAMGSVGYAQVRRMLAGETPRDQLEDSIVRATRVFARRQRTWLRTANVTWLGEPAPAQSSSGT